MTDNDCPKCPKHKVKMIPDSNGVCKCPVCGAAYIPSGCEGIFIPASYIGIHKKEKE